MRRFFRRRKTKEPEDKSVWGYANRHPRRTRIALLAFCIFFFSFFWNAGTRDPEETCPVLQDAQNVFRGSIWIIFFSLFFIVALFVQRNFFPQWGMFPKSNFNVGKTLTLRGLGALYALGSLVYFIILIFMYSNLHECNMNVSTRQVAAVSFLFAVFLGITFFLHILETRLYREIFDPDFLKKKNKNSKKIGNDQVDDGEEIDDENDDNDANDDNDDSTKDQKRQDEKRYAEESLALKEQQENEYNTQFVETMKKYGYWVARLTYSYEKQKDVFYVITALIGLILAFSFVSVFSKNNLQLENCTYKNSDPLVIFLNIAIILSALACVILLKIGPPGSKVFPWEMNVKSWKNQKREEKERQQKKKNEEDAQLQQNTESTIDDANEIELENVKLKLKERGKYFSEKKKEKETILTANKLQSSPSSEIQRVEKELKEIQEKEEEEKNNLIQEYAQVRTKVLKYKVDDTDEKDTVRKKLLERELEAEQTLAKREAERIFLQASTSTSFPFGTVRTQFHVLPMLHSMGYTSDMNEQEITAAKAEEEKLQSDYSKTKILYYIPPLTLPILALVNVIVLSVSPGAYTGSAFCESQTPAISATYILSYFIAGFGLFFSIVIATHVAAFREQRDKEMRNEEESENSILAWLGSKIWKQISKIQFLKWIVENIFNPVWSRIKKFIPSYFKVGMTAKTTEVFIYVLLTWTYYASVLAFFIGYILERTKAESTDLFYHDVELKTGTHVFSKEFTTWLLLVPIFNQLLIFAILHSPYMGIRSQYGQAHYRNSLRVWDKIQGNITHEKTRIRVFVFYWFIMLLTLVASVLVLRVFFRNGGDFITDHLFLFIETMIVTISTFYGFFYYFSRNNVTSYENFDFWTLSVASIPNTLKQTNYFDLRIKIRDDDDESNNGVRGNARADLVFGPATTQGPQSV